MKKIHTYSLFLITYSFSALAALTAQAATISYDSDATITEALTLEEDTEISVGKGATVTYNAAISGNFKLTKTGVGTLVLGAANSFGSLDINAGVLTVGKAGALGSGAVTIAGSTSAACQLRFDTTLIQTAATFSNAITLSSSSANGYPAIYFVLPTASQKDIWTVTFTGGITANGDLYIGDNHGGKSGSESTGANWENKQWVVFDCAVNVVGNLLRLGCGPSYHYKGPGGDVYFMGAVSAATFCCGGYSPSKYGSGGRVYFSSSDNQIGVFQFCYNNVYIQNKNALGDAKVYISDGYSTARSILTLSGDQRAKSLQGTYKSTTSKVIKPSSASTLTLDGGSADSDSTGISLQGELTLVVDASEDDFVQTYTGGFSTMTGPIVVKKGALKIAGASNFGSVPELDVQGGLLEVNSTIDNCFTSVETVKVSNGGLLSITNANETSFSERAVNLSLSGEGKIYIPQGTTLRVKTLTINGELQKAGQYTATENIIGGGTIDTLGTTVINTWNGQGTDDLINNQDNWEKTVASFDDGSLEAIFASTGEEAVVNTKVVLSSIKFDTPEDASGFTLSKEGSGVLELLAEPLFVDDQDSNEDEHVYTFGVPTTPKTEQSWNVPINDILKVTEGLTSEYGVSMDGKGTLEIGGTNTIDGRLEFSNFERLTLTGKITASNPEEQGEPSSLITGHSLYINHAGVADSASDETIPVVLDNVHIDKPIYADPQNNSYRKLLYCKPSTTNILSRKFATPKGQFGIAVGTNAVVNFTGGVSSSWSFYKTGYGLLRVAEDPWYQDSSLLAVYGGRVRFESTGNRFNRLVVNYSSSYLEFAVDNSIKSAATCELSGGTMNISVGTQCVPFVLATTAATLTGSEGTALFFTNGGVPVDATKYGTTNLCCKITGAVGITQGGANKLIINTVSESTGPLAVTNGVLELTANASWLYGTDFTARGKGTLKLASADQINGGIAALHLADSGKLELPNEAVLRVSSAETNGVALANGTYTSAELGSFLSDGATLKVGGKGTTIYLW